MIKQLEIEIGDTVRIAETSSYYNALRETNPKCDGVVREIRGHLGVDWENNTSNIYQPYDLILIKKGKTMQFTKSDLKTGMFVRNRGGDYKVVIGEVLSGLDACTTLGNFSDSLISNNCEGYDIVAVYEVKGTVYLRTYLNGSSLEVIWERTEQTPAQKEMEVLQAKMDELQEQMKVVKAKL
jgi:hypothetical protein